MGKNPILEVAMVLAAASSTATAAGRLDITLIERIDCSVLTSQACFRLTLRAVDGRIPAADPNTLLAQFAITANGAKTIPFHLQSLATDQAGAKRSRVTMILLDVSGSMSDQQYSAAVQSARSYIRDFDPALDVVGVATFGSRGGVVNAIRATPVGRTMADVERAIAALPKPQTQNNTALYSAVGAGLDWLENWINTNPGTQTFLVVLTDGRNDVKPHDDPGLLQGPDGLRFIADRIARSPVQVLPIGLQRAGRPDSISEPELRALGGPRTRIVSPGDDLNNVFVRYRQYSLSDLRISTVLPNNGQSLTGLDLRFQAAHTDGLAGTGVWRAPELGPSVSESASRPEEMEALRSKLDVIPAAGNEIWELLRPIIVFIAWALFLAVLRYLVPKLIWPDADAEIYQTTPGYRPKGSYGFDSSPGGDRKGRSERDKTIRVPK